MMRSGEKAKNVKEVICRINQNRKDPKDNIGRSSDLTEENIKKAAFEFGESN